MDELPNWNILVLELADGYSVRNGDLARPIFWPQSPNQDYLIGTHTKTGLWGFYGREISSTSRLRASVLDLPPTILSYLGIPIPQRMEGQVLPIFQSGENSE